MSLRQYDLCSRDGLGDGSVRAADEMVSNRVLLHKLIMKCSIILYSKLTVEILKDQICNVTPAILFQTAV